MYRDQRRQHRTGHQMNNLLNANHEFQIISFTSFIVTSSLFHRKYIIIKNIKGKQGL